MAPITMYKIGFDIRGNFDHISKATDAGIITVRQLIPAALAEVKTGAVINATTAGRMPLNIAVMVGFEVIISGVKNIAIDIIMTNEGIIVPIAATILPFTPFSLSPTAAEILTARIPGKACAMASRSRKSFRSSHLCLSTISRSIIEIIAHPPPKVNAPIFKNVKNKLKYIKKLTIR